MTQEKMTQKGDRSTQEKSSPEEQETVVENKSVDGENLPEGAQDGADDDDTPVVSDDENEDEDVLDPLARVAALEEELSQKHNLYLRAIADMDNLRKRCRRDVEDAIGRGRIDVLSELLPALDSVDMAVKSVVPTDENQGIFDGLLMVKKQLISAGERFAFQEIDAKGKPFDPMFHEAVAHVPSKEFESGLVIEDMRRGYILGERLVRASMVVVSSGPPPDVAIDSDKNDEKILEDTDTQPLDGKPMGGEMSEASDGGGGEAPPENE